MSDSRVYMDFEDPGEAPRKSSPGRDALKARANKPEAPKQAGIPSLPTPDRPLTGDEVRAGVSASARAVAKYKELGYSYLEIAEIMELQDAATAKRMHHAVIAATATPDSIETQRAIVLGRAERLFRQSFAYATADYLEVQTEDGTTEQVPNAQKLAWHSQAQSDLMQIATLTGAKAPTRVEFTPADSEIERIVAEMARRAGHQEVLEAEVLELTQIDDVDRDDIDEVYG